MKISSLYIKNFKSIKELYIDDIEQALILVGKNNTGKTVILDAVLAVTGSYEIKAADYFEANRPIVIGGSLTIDEEDLLDMNQKGMVSKYRNYTLWLQEFKNRLPSYQDGELRFECSASTNTRHKLIYKDGVKKNNIYISKLFPKIYYIDSNRDIRSIQEDILEFQGNDDLSGLRDNICMFDKAKQCNHCFQCIGLIHQKGPKDLTIYETTRLMEHKLFELNLNTFVEKLNKKFQRNGGGMQEVIYEIKLNVDEIFRVNTYIKNKGRNVLGPLDHLSAGLKSIYILSLLETYIEEKDHSVSSIIMMEDPEMFLHPQLQKVASEILYQLSKKNQVIFSTHSPNMIFNFSSRQIKQVILNQDWETVINEDSDIDEILSDMGYTANDLMNVNFVFIVEGKQDGARLPMLLENYYSEIYDENNKLQRIAIIPVNSCTNIKTYANLKYINKLYLKDQFMMIRDSDGKDPEVLKRQLCRYYKDRETQDEDNLPRVMPRNVLILKYYSFENYFLEPDIMVKVGILKKKEDFYNTLYSKYKDYLFRLTSTKKMLKELGIRINSKQDLKDNIENIKIYVRGHNLFDIFYGKYKGSSKDEILQKYIDAAPREVFEDILNAIDNFVYFENRRKDVD